MPESRANFQKSMEVYVEFTFNYLEFDTSEFTEIQQDDPDFITAAEIEEKRKIFGGCEWKDISEYIKSHITSEGLLNLLMKGELSFQCGEKISVSILLYDHMAIS